MADTKISDASAASTLTGAELVGGVQSAASVKITIDQILAYVRAVESTVTAVTSTSGVVNIDCSLGNYFTLTLDENVTSITFSNLPGAGNGATLMIRITQDSTPRTVAWPASFRWVGGTDGVVSTGSGDIDVLAITTFDNGTTWIATLANDFAA